MTTLMAPFLLVRRVLPGMVERGFARIVLLSSVAAYTGGIIGAHYASSKAGLHGLAHSIAKQAARDGVTANVIAPALIESDMLPADPAARADLAAQLPAGRLGRPEEVADLIAAVVANGFLSNQSILIDGGRHPTRGRASRRIDAGPPGATTLDGGAGSRMLNRSV